MSGKHKHASEAAYIVTNTNLGASRPEDYVATSAQAIQDTGVKPWLETVGIDVKHAQRIDAATPNFKDKSNAKNLDAVIEHSEAIAKVVEEQRRLGRLIIATGGDHSMSLGTVAGIEAAAEGEVGMIIIDQHLDFNTPETTPSGNIHGFPLAANTGQPGGEEQQRLANIYRKKSKLKASNTLVIGVSDTDPGELERALEAKVDVVTMDEIDERQRKLQFIFDKIDELRKRVGVVYVSIDMDGISQADVTGTPMPNSRGITAEEAMQILNYIRQEDEENTPEESRRAPIVGVEVVELAPALDDGRSKRLAHEMIKEVMTWNQAGTPIEISEPMPTPRQLHDQIHSLLDHAVGNEKLWKEVDAVVAEADMIIHHKLRKISFVQAVAALEKIKERIEIMLHLAA